MHIQGYIELASPSKYTAVKKILNDNTAHVEPAQGNPQQCIDYATKEDTRVSEEDGGWSVYYGDEPDGQGARTDLKAFIADIVKGDNDKQLIQTHTTCYAKYSRLLVSVRAAFAEPRNSAPKVKVYWGPTGSGKSASAHLELPGAYIKAAGNKWWCGYQTGNNIILDDFVDTWWDIGYMLTLLDRYPCKIEVSDLVTRSRGHER